MAPQSGELCGEEVEFVLSDEFDAEVTMLVAWAALL